MENEYKETQETKEIKPKRPNNGWSYEHDELLSIWCDKAGCYTWMHDATQRKFRSINMKLGIPVIVLSTISGTANFGISTIFPSGFGYGNAVIGSLSLITGVISTISNFLGYAQSEEAHRIASIQWAKFRRTLETELALNPIERTDAIEFVKHCKAELDRLMEQNPVIPKDIIERFKKVFRKNNTISMPEICNKLDHTRIFVKRDELKPTDPKSIIDQQISDLVLDNNTEKSIIKNVNAKLNMYISDNKQKQYNPLIKRSLNESETEELNDNVNIINYVNDDKKGDLEIKIPVTPNTKINIKDSKGQTI